MVLRVYLASTRHLVGTTDPHTCTYIYTHYSLHVCTYVCLMYVCMYVCMCMCAYVCVCACVRMYVYMMYVYMHVCIHYVCMFVCLFEALYLLPCGGWSSAILSTIDATLTVSIHGVLLGTCGDCLRFNLNNPTTLLPCNEAESVGFSLNRLSMICRRGVVTGVNGRRQPSSCKYVPPWECNKSSRPTPSPCPPFSMHLYQHKSNSFLRGSLQVMRSICIVIFPSNYIGWCCQSRYNQLTIRPTGSQCYLGARLNE